MNINQIRYFASSVESGSLSAAAAEHGITAQGVSKSVADLEHEIGIPLLERKNRGVAPTAFGLQFYERALPILHRFSRLEEFARTLGEGGSTPAEEARLFICAPSFYKEQQICDDVSSFISSQLKMPVSVAFSTTDRCLASLCAHSSDLFIVIGAADIPGVSCVPLGTIPCGVQVTQTHPLVERGCVSLSDLTEYSVAVWPGHEFFNERFKKLVASKGVRVSYQKLQPTEKDASAFYAANGMIAIPRIAALDSRDGDSIPLPFDAKSGLTVPLSLLVSEQGRTRASAVLERSIVSVAAGILFKPSTR